MVRRAARNADRVGDHLQGGRADPVPGEQLQSGIQDAGTGGAVL